MENMNQMYEKLFWRRKIHDEMHTSNQNNNNNNKKKKENRVCYVVFCVVKRIMYRVYRDFFCGCANIEYET